MKLTEQQAADMINRTTKTMFLLRGNGPGRMSFVTEVYNLATDRDFELRVNQVGYATRSLHDNLGDTVNYIINYPSDGLFVLTNGFMPSEVQRFNGLAILLGYRPVVIDNFMTEDNKKNTAVVEEKAPPYDPNLPDCILVDLDGTLFDSSHRRHYGPSREEILSDKLIEHVAYLVETFAAQGVTIIFATARGETEGETEATMEQLANNFPHLEFFLAARKVGDKSEDALFKLEFYDEVIRGKFNVLLVLDDRPKVVRMWGELGLPVLANGAYMRGEY